MTIKKREPVQLPVRIHFNEYATLHTDMTSTERAGFKAYCMGKEWMRQQEWDDAYKSYTKQK